MKKKAFLILPVLFLIFTSCHKADENQPGPASNDVKENEYPSSFNWATTREVVIEIAGLTALPDFKRVLSIETPEGSVYLKQLIMINKDFQTKIIIPSTVTQVVVKCGNIQSTIPVTDGKIVFSLNTGNSGD